ncbi:MAG: hypothetical protein KDA20_07110 [Phycisphaerales bacterium]|nr:hypothetical protein [Phycisphaerales bacterium]
MLAYSAILNETFGWLWMGVGVLSGAALGLRFHRDRFLGGYASWPRRLLRLGHIAFFGLGILNVLFACSLPRIDLAPPWPAIASFALIAGAVLMPTCCALAAWRRKFVPLFAAPVLSVATAITITWIGLLIHALQQTGASP